jgi:hypothetical protein
MTDERCWRLASGPSPAAFTVTRRSWPSWRTRIACGDQGDLHAILCFVSKFAAPGSFT